MRGGPNQGQPKKIAPAAPKFACLYFYTYVYTLEKHDILWGSKSGVKHHNEKDFLTLSVYQKKLVKHNVANGVQFNWILSACCGCWPDF